MEILAKRTIILSVVYLLIIQLFATSGIIDNVESTSNDNNVESIPSTDNIIQSSTRTLGTRNGGGSGNSDFLITTTSDFNDGTKSLSDGNYEVETITDNPRFFKKL